MQNTILQLTKKLVAIPSVFPHEQDLANHIATMLGTLNCTVQRIPASHNRDMIVATFGKTKKYLCLYGHMDTVEPDPLWQQDPYTVTTTDDGLAHGLGVADMKAGLAILLKVGLYAHTQNLPLKLAFGVDEENLSLGSHTLSQHKFFTDVGFIISAESGQIYDENQPFAVNYGRKGRFVLECAVAGVTAHAARSDQAVNAIFEAGRLLELFKEVTFPTHPQLGTVEFVPYSLQSTTNSFSVPSSARLLVNVLTVPGVSSAQVIKKISTRARKNKLNATFTTLERETPYMEAYQVETSNPDVAQTAKIFESYNVQPGYAQSVADENRFAHTLNIPVISIGPIGGGDHTANEWLKVSSLQPTFECYKALLEKYTREK